MKILSATLYPLSIPFVDSFSHSLASRNCSDSVIVKLTTDTGIAGYGEALPRPYVTGETKQGCIDSLKNQWLPAILGVDLSGIGSNDILVDVERLLAGCSFVGNSARGAVELALIDCLLRSFGNALSSILPAKIAEVVYSGVITSGTSEKVEKIARRLKSAGLRVIKVKVETSDDVGRVALVREIMGPDVSIRLDANGAFNSGNIMDFLSAVARYNIDCIEQPIPRGVMDEWAILRRASPIPLMVDESLVTIGDAEALIEQKACDYFNLRISKLGGIAPTLAIARLATNAGIGIQLGCLVGETAILSAAGRQLAAHLAGLRFIEGSYGSHLLIEDIADEDITFGSQGRAPLLSGSGFGVTIREDLLLKYAEQVITVH